MTQQLQDWFYFVGSYSLQDFIPIESNTYLRLFERLNTQLWPLPLLTILISLLLIWATAGKDNQKTYWRRFAGLLLAIFWFTAAYCFHQQLLSELTWVGHYFALLFTIQGFLLLFFFSRIQSGIVISGEWSNPQTVLGWVMLFVSVAIYPIMPLFSARSWLSAEMVGISPNPTCLMTMGLLLLSNNHRWWLMVIPFLWVVIAVIFAHTMNVVGDWVLAVSGFLLMLLMISEKIFKRPE